jgi:hypothetical protein
LWLSASSSLCCLKRFSQGPQPQIMIRPSVSWNRRVERGYGRRPTFRCAFSIGLHEAPLFGSAASPGLWDLGVGLTFGGSSGIVSQQFEDLTVKTKGMRFDNQLDQRVLKSVCWLELEIKLYRVFSVFYRERRSLDGLYIETAYIISRNQGFPMMVSIAPSLSRFACVTQQIFSKS